MPFTPPKVISLGLAWASPMKMMSEYRVPSSIRVTPCRRVEE
jgi:hypothetical protein